VFDIPKSAAINSLELQDSPFSGGVTVDVSYHALTHAGEAEGFPSALTG
jgi:hypothetical protein